MAVTRVTNQDVKNDTVREEDISVPAAGSDGQFLQKDSTETPHGWKWADAAAPVGPTPPATPDAGDTFFSTTANDFFYYDDVRGEWLGMSLYQVMQVDGGAIENKYPKLMGEEPKPGDNGPAPLVPFAATVVGMSFSNMDTITGPIEVHSNFVNVATVNIVTAAEIIDMTLDANIPINTRLVAYYGNFTLSKPDRSCVQIFYRQRLP